MSNTIVTMEGSTYNILGTFKEVKDSISSKFIIADVTHINKYGFLELTIRPQFSNKKYLRAKTYRRHISELSGFEWLSDKYSINGIIKIDGVNYLEYNFLQSEPVYLLFVMQDGIRYYINRKNYNGDLVTDPTQALFRFSKTNAIKTANDLTKSRGIPVSVLSTDNIALLSFEEV